MKFLGICMFCLLVTTSCATPPDNKKFENGWTVIRNDCEQDMWSEIRSKKSFGSATRVVTINHLQKKVFQLDIHATRGGLTKEITTYNPDEANTVHSRQKLGDRRSDTSDQYAKSLKHYFADRPELQDFDEACLARGSNEPFV